MRRNLTCIVCPMGCSIDVTMDKDGKITEIVGNTCPRGAEYAKNECTNPTRVVTSTAMTADGRPVPVKTNRPIPKDKIFEAESKVIKELADKGKISFTAATKNRKYKKYRTNN